MALGIHRLEWIDSNGTGNGTDPYATGSEGCWVTMHGSDNLAWYQFNAHKVGWIVAGVFALVATILSGIHIVRHLKNYTV
ncbi:hypothetical protein EC988_004974, partial [Linderina pennispora]